MSSPFIDQGIPPSDPQRRPDGSPPVRNPAEAAERPGSPDAEAAGNVDGATGATGSRCDPGDPGTPGEPGEPPSASLREALLHAIAQVQEAVGRPDRPLRKQLRIGVVGGSELHCGAGYYDRHKVRIDVDELSAEEAVDRVLAELFNAD